MCPLYFRDWFTWRSCYSQLLQWIVYSASRACARRLGSLFVNQLDSHRSGPTGSTFPAPRPREIIGLRRRGRTCLLRFLFLLFGSCKWKAGGHLSHRRCGVTAAFCLHWSTMLSCSLASFTRGARECFYNKWGSALWTADSWNGLEWGAGRSHTNAQGCQTL